MDLEFTVDDASEDLDLEFTVFELGVEVDDRHFFKDSIKFFISSKVGLEK